MFRIRSLAISLIILTNCFVAFTQDFSSMWENFWSVSCEFSDLVPSSDRAKRSMNLEPNLDDPEELFQYLYPLADMKLDEHLADEMRSSHSMSTWIDDAMELWQSECHSRKKREKRSASEDDNEDSLYPKYSPAEGKEKSLDNSTTTTTTTTTTTPPPKKEKKVIPDGDTFFAQYGGDIEYFFPLISFGIPFDGEITFLGFHGFKGLFPYK